MHPHAMLKSASKFTQFIEQRLTLNNLETLLTKLSKLAHKLSNVIQNLSHCDCVFFAMLFLNFNFGLVLCSFLFFFHLKNTVRNYNQNYIF